MAMSGHRQFVLRTVEERGVKFVRLWFIDVLGLLKSVSIPVSELESALEEGVGLDGSSLEGASRLREHDVIAHPDPRTFQVLPWRPDTRRRSGPRRRAGTARSLGARARGRNEPDLRGLGRGGAG